MTRGLRVCVTRDEYSFTDSTPAAWPRQLESHPLFQLVRSAPTRAALLVFLSQKNSNYLTYYGNGA